MLTVTSRPNYSRSSFTVICNSARALQWAKPSLGICCFHRHTQSKPEKHKEVKAIKHSSTSLNFQYDWKHTASGNPHAIVSGQHSASWSWLGTWPGTISHMSTLIMTYVGPSSFTSPPPFFFFFKFPSSFFNKHLTGSRGLTATDKMHGCCQRHQAFYLLLE